MKENDALAALELFGQLGALGALAGVLGAQAVAPWRRQAAKHLGVSPQRLEARYMAGLCVALFELAALVYVVAGCARGVRLSALPVVGTPLVGGACGAGVFSLLRGGRTNNVELARAAAVGAAIALLASAAVRHESAALEFILFGAIGASFALVWVRIRKHVLARLSRVTGLKFRAAPPHLLPSVLVGAGGGMAAAVGVLASGVVPLRGAEIPAAAAIAVFGAGVSRLPAGRIRFKQRIRRTRTQTGVAEAEATTALEQEAAASQLAQAPLGQKARVTLGGYTTTVWRRPALDDRAGAPLMFVSGLSGNGLAPWDVLAAEVAPKTPKELISIVLPVLHAGTRPLGPGPKIEQLEAFLRAAIAALSPDEPVILVASSLGGAVSLKLACDPSVPVLGVFTLGTLGFAVAPGLRPLTWAPLRSILKAVRPAVPLSLVRRVAIGYRLRFNPNVDPDSLDEFAREVADPRELKRLIVVAELVNETNDLIDPDQIALPFFAGWGAEDRTSSPSIRGWLERRRPDGHYAVIPGAGHDPHITHAREVSDLLLPFAELVSSV